MPKNRHKKMSRGLALSKTKKLTKSELAASVPFLEPVSELYPEASAVLGNQVRSMKVAGWI